MALIGLDFEQPESIEQQPARQDCYAEAAPKESGSFASAAAPAAAATYPPVNLTEQLVYGSTAELQEPLYCFCRQVSFGDMVGCDNEGCTIEWFHYACVGLTCQPKSKWYCDECRRRTASTAGK